MEPIRIVEKKGNKYLVEWKGNNNKNSWETKANLGISFRLIIFPTRFSGLSSADVGQRLKSGFD